MSSTVAVVGSGPIGVATAYGLVRAGIGNVTLVTGTPDTATYRSSGGSVCWHRSDPEKAAMIRATAEFVQERVAAGAPIQVREQPYLFLDQGVLVPALNVAASDLVSDLATLAVRGGARPLDIGLVVGVERVEGGHRVVGERGTVDAAVVVLALGVGNAALTGGPQPALEKRQLFVLDVPVTAERTGLPHLVAPIGTGYAYVFVKQTPDGLRLLLGQEDLVEDRDLSGPVDHLAELLAAGVADRFPFLRGAAASQLPGPVRDGASRSRWTGTGWCCAAAPATCGCRSALRCAARASCRGGCASCSPAARPEPGSRDAGGRCEEDVTPRYVRAGPPGS